MKKNYVALRYLSTMRKELKKKKESQMKLNLENEKEVGSSSRSPVGFKITFYDEVTSLSIETAYAEFLHYLAEVVKYEDLTAFDFESIKIQKSEADEGIVLGG